MADRPDDNWSNDDGRVFLTCSYDLIYTYQVVFGFVNDAANNLFTLTSLIHSSGTRDHTYCNRVHRVTAYNRHMEQP